MSYTDLKVLEANGVTIPQEVWDSYHLAAVIVVFLILAVLFFLLCMAVSGIVNAVKEHKEKRKWRND